MGLHTTPAENLRVLKRPLGVLIGKAAEKKRLASLHYALEDVLWDGQSLANRGTSATQDEILAYLTTLESVVNQVDAKESKSLCRAKADCLAIATLTRRDLAVLQ